MSDAYYNNVAPTNPMLKELGIDINNLNPTFDPNNQPKQVGKQFTQNNNKNKNKNKYEQNDQHQEQQRQLQKQQGNNQEDIQIPRNLLAVSTINKTVGEAEKKGRKKQSKNQKKKKAGLKDDKKQEIKIDVDLDEVAEWGERGAKNNNQQSDQSSFDVENQKNQINQNKDQQEAIKKRIEQKLKKYENPGTYGGQPKNTTTSLKDKALQLKNKNEQKKQQRKETNVQDQSTNQILNIKQPKKEEKVLENKEQQQSQDPWDKVNERTIAQKQQQHNAIKNAQNMDLNKYYKQLQLPEDDQLQQQQQPETGFFQSLCSCLKPKRKSITDLQKQIIKISKIQLTNKAEQTQLLKQIWTMLTNKKYLRYGQHWNQIGFQGRDPATDLRSTGILSLLHWYNFINFDLQYALKIKNLCVQFDIPLALTHIKTTSLVCSSIKKRLLEGKKWQDFQQWYNAFAYYSFQYIIKNGKDLEQIGQLVQKAIQRTRNNIQNAKTVYNNQIKSKR